RYARNVRAMLLERQREPLTLRDIPAPMPGTGQIRIRVSACAVCRTDLHVVDGELPEPKLPLVVGHQIVGIDDRGRRVGVRWLGFYGFGSAAQIVAQIAAADGREIYAFTRDGDDAAQAFALRMGAVWAGGSSEAKALDGAIIFAPAGEIVVSALRNVVKGGTVVC